MHAALKSGLFGFIRPAPGHRGEQGFAEPLSKNNFGLSGAAVTMRMGGM